MRFFVDNCLPPRLARAFNELGKPEHTFVHLREHPALTPSSTDVEWIELLVKEKNWVILTKDKNIMKKPVEKAAFQSAKLTGFFLDKTWKDLDFWTQTSKLAQLMPKIISLAEISKPGTCFKVPVRSKDIHPL